MPKTENKQSIAFDIDDVLAANAEGFVKFSNERWGTHLTPDDYTEHWAEMWKISHEETESRRQEIIAARLFLNHRFFDEAKPVLEKLASKYKLVVVTSRSLDIAADTRAWIEEEFGDIFSEVHFARIWDNPNTHILDKIKGTKAQICKEIGADYLIDDQPKHVLAAAEAGIESILFGDYYWSRSVDLPKGVHRAKTWQEVLEYFDEKG